MRSQGGGDTAKALMMRASTQLTGLVGRGREGLRCSRGAVQGALAPHSIGLGEKEECPHLDQVECRHQLGRAAFDKPECELSACGAGEVK